MKKDINPPKVEDIGMAIVLETNELNEEEWNAYLINLKKHDLDTVLVRSNGYSEDKKTTELRHFFEKIPARSAHKIEMVMPETFVMTNQFWMSYVNDKNQILDKKYVFVPGSIDKKNLVNVPILEKKGVVIL